MPWKIESRGNQFAVVNEATGETKCVEPTMAKAEAYLRALYANVPEAARSAKEHDRAMRKGGPTGMTGKRGAMNPPLQPIPPGPQAPGAAVPAPTPTPQGPLPL